MKYWSVGEWMVSVVFTAVLVLFTVVIAMGIYVSLQSPLDPKREYLRSCKYRDGVPNVASNNWREWTCER